MKKDTLQVEQNGQRFRLQWYLQEEHDLGGYLDPEHSTSEEIPLDSDERQIWLAVKAVQKLAAEHDIHGFFWETEREAKKALSAVKVAWKTDDAPWPEWAVKALSEGFRAPKGWKP